MATALTSYNVAPNPNDATQTGLPVGAITMWATSTAPAQWLICNGSAVSRITYATLFAVLGTTYGAGDGSTTFNLPNASGSTIRGVGGSYTLASTGGADSITLAANQLPNHSHTLNDPGHFHNTTAAQQSNTGASGLADRLCTQTSIQSDTKTTGITMSDSLKSGGTQVTQVATSIINPYLTLNYIIKAY